MPATPRLPGRIVFVQWLRHAARIMSSAKHRAKARTAWADFWSHSASHADHRFRDAGTAGVLREHWDNVFATRFVPGASLSVLDAACGEGALLRAARDRAGAVDDLSLHLHCTDIAPAAVRAAAESVGDALPVAPVVADGAALPYADESFDCVVSQFGLEYAGVDAFADAARVTAPTGALSALVHREGGAIEVECRANLALLEAVREAGLLRTLERLSSLATRQAAGKAAPAALTRAVERFHTASASVGEALRAAQPGAARTLIERLWRDCSTAAARAGRYGAGDLEAWLAAHAAELDAYAHRMRSMIEAARDEAEMAEIASGLEAYGLTTVDIGEVRARDGDPPLAWSVSASAGAG